MRKRITRLLAATVVATLLVAAAPWRGAEAAGTATVAPVHMDATLACVAGGGASVTFTVRNLGHATLTIHDEFDLALSAVRPGGPQPVALAFVFPAPGFDVIAPGESKTFIVPIGGDGESSVSLQAKRLLLDATVWFEGRSQPVTRTFTFPGCPA